MTTTPFPAQRYIVEESQLALEAAWLRAVTSRLCADCGHWQRYGECAMGKCGSEKQKVGASARVTREDERCQEYQKREAI